MEERKWERKLLKAELRQIDDVKSFQKSNNDNVQLVWFYYYFFVYFFSLQEIQEGVYVTAFFCSFIRHNCPSVKKEPGVDFFDMNPSPQKFSPVSVSHCSSFYFYLVRQLQPAWRVVGRLWRKLDNWKDTEEIKEEIRRGGRKKREKNEGRNKGTERIYNERRKTDRKWWEKNWLNKRKLRSNRCQE